MRGSSRWLTELGFWGQRTGRAHPAFMLSTFNTCRIKNHVLVHRSKMHLLCWELHVFFEMLLFKWIALPASALLFECCGVIGSAHRPKSPNEHLRFQAAGKPLSSLSWALFPGGPSDLACPARQHETKAHPNGIESPNLLGVSKFMT